MMASPPASLRRFAELDVGAPAGHVGRNGHGAGKARSGHNLGLALVLLRVQHLVFECP